MSRLVGLLVLLLGVTVARADEVIQRYDIDIQINADASLDVTERITLRAEGQQIRRGIYRDFPTRYRDRYGNRVVVDLEVLSVERNGSPEPWFTEKLSNGIRINTGNDDLLQVPAEHTFTLRYRTTRQLGFFEQHDELYWNAIGTAWVFPILAGTVTARLPQPVPPADLGAEVYTGRQGARERNATAAIPQAGLGQWELTQPLSPYEGLTVVLTFPKGIVAAPTPTQRAFWFLRDNLGALIAVAGFLALLAFCIREWRRVGRDPRRGVIIARYEPPQGHGPASLRYLQRMSYDELCFSSAVLNLAVSGLMRVAREARMLKKDAWHLERVEGDAAQSDPGEGILLDSLFRGGSNSIRLHQKNAQRLSHAMLSHGRALRRRMQPRYFRLNGWSTAKAVAIAVATFVIALMVSAGAGMIVIIPVGILSIVTVIVFGLLVRAPTAEGRALLDEIEGLKLYLSVAERDELARLSGPGEPPQLDARRYEMLLPYAVALGVEEAWTKKFTLAVGAAAAAAAARNIGWYRGGAVDDLTSFSRAIGESLSSQIASSSTPPGSSSGSGGGGSSGGGGGGGGGGGR